MTRQLEIQVLLRSAGRWNPTHRSIAVVAEGWPEPEDCTEETLEEIRDAYTAAGSIIARVIAFAGPWIARSAGRHRCLHWEPWREEGYLLGLQDYAPVNHPFYMPDADGCHAYADMSVLSQHRSGDEGLEAPIGDLNVPADEVDEWMRMVVLWLRAVIEDPHIPPTPFVRLADQTDELTLAPTTTTHDDTFPSGYPHRVSDGVIVVNPWTPVGDCEHEVGGRDIAPATQLPRCKTCRKEERARALARESVAGFRPPDGPGRCTGCGFHTPTQGHREGCEVAA